MKGMVSRDKMSKRNRRSLDLARRSVWGINPVTRVRESGKLYDRCKVKRSYEEV